MMFADASQGDELFWIDDEESYTNLADSLSTRQVDELVANTAIVCKLQTEMSLANLITKGADGIEYVITAGERRC